MASVWTQGLTPLAKLVLLLGATLLLAGAIWHGLAFEDIKRLWLDLFERPGGPMSFRFVLQPIMATLAAVHDGIRDASAHRTPYFKSLLIEPEKRGARLSEGVVSTARILLLGLVMDVIYQWRVLATFYPGEAVVIAVVLAFIPYVILRGPVARLARRWIRRRLATHPHQGASR